jgi:ATP-dependent Clp protease ATP-binding subunit ClpA/ATP-dependent Clp protease ATP-binding subunit ClpC
MLLAAARAIEAERDVTFEPFALRTLQELGASLIAHRAMPGKVLELLERMAGRGPTRGALDPDTKNVGPSEVIDFLGKITGLPASLLDRDKPIEREEIETDLRSRVMGQNPAVRIAAELVLKIRTGMADPRRPYGVYLFTGPTGTGKTELAKAIASELYGSEERLLRFDMGELGGPDAAARLVGDAWNPEGALTRAVREQPFCVVLFDEVEKAHPSVLNLFLQLFEDGRLTDAAGNLTTFHHAVVIMTSNLGARAQALPLGAGFVAGDESARLRESVAADVAKAVREFFPPELFNRIDRVVSFAPLTHDIAIDVAQKELGKLLNRRGLSNRQIFVRANRAVVERIAAEAFEQADGARSLKRFLEDRIGSILGEQIAAHPAAALRVMHLFAGKSGDQDFRVEQEALVEAKPIEIRSALEPLLDLPTEELVPHVQAALPELDELEPELEAVADDIRARLQRRDGKATYEAVFHLDALRSRLFALRDRLESLLIASRDLEREAIERHRFSHEVFEFGRGFDRTRTRLRLLAEAPQDQRTATRRELLAILAEVWFLRRALRRGHDVSRHSALIEIVPLAPRATFLLPLLDTYSRAMTPPRLPPRGELEEWAALYDGRIETGHGEKALIERISAEQPRVLVAQVVGPCIADLFEEETGTHLLEGHAIAPELLRVRVLGGGSPRGAAEEFQRMRQAFDRSTGDVPRPDALLPIVRRVRREEREPPRPGQKTPIKLSVEDYKLGWADTIVARDLEAALSPVFLLRLSRLDLEDA